jgi:hypothetical protein
MVKPNTVDVNEVCTTIERITARIMDMLPDKMFYVNYDVTRDQSAEMDLLATLLRDCTRLLKATAEANWREHLGNIRYEYSNNAVRDWKRQASEHSMKDLMSQLTDLERDQLGKEVRDS